MISEIWKDINHYKGYYKINNSGKIISIKESKNSKNNTFKKSSLDSNINTQSNKIYCSIREAAKENNLNEYTLTRKLRGELKNNTNLQKIFI